MTEQAHGRYFAEELVLEEGADARGRIQHSLDAGERRGWRLVGVSDVPPERRVVLFWDTIRPSFGRTSEERFVPRIRGTHLQADAPSKGW